MHNGREEQTVTLRGHSRRLAAVIIWLELRLPNCPHGEPTTQVKSIYPHTVPGVALFHLYTCTGSYSCDSQMLGQTDLM